MKATNRELIDELIAKTKDVLNQAEELAQLDSETLNKKATPEKWSALECLEHLNRYGDFYLPEISRCLNGAKKVNENHLFKSSWLGEYFAQSVSPREKLNKMNAFKSMNPVGSKLDTKVVGKFIRQQHQMLDLLTRARTVDMRKTKTNISISKWLTLRMGDTFRVVIYHNQRHLVQARKAVG
ncbi:MAG: DinB family protein [Flavobacteriales bacterium]